MKKTTLKPSNNDNSFCSTRVKKITKRTIDDYAREANNKSYGRKITSDDILSMALSLVTKNEILKLQKESIRNGDRKSKFFAIYNREPGPITADEFDGFLMSPEFSKFRKTHEKEVEAMVAGL